MKKIWIVIIAIVLLGCAKEEMRPIDYSKEGTKYLLGAGGVNKNIAKALIYHGKACNQGYALSCGALGWIYEDDTEATKELKQNLPLAKQWYRKACDMGEKSACNGLKRVKALMKGDPCNTAISSFIKHTYYIHENNYYDNTVCNHVRSAIRENIKILKICKQDILFLRGYYKERDILLRSSDIIRRCKD